MHEQNTRLAQVERRLRHVSWLALTSFGALVLFVGAAATQKAEENLSVRELTAASISTGSFTVRDEQGRPRVAIRLGKDGGPFVTLLDENRKVRLLLSLQDNEHPLVQFSNAEENPQMNLFYNTQLGAGLVMAGTKGGAVYALPTGASPVIEFTGADGQKIFAAP